MAACRRVQRLLLLMFICGWIGSAHGGKSDTENAAENAERGKNGAGEGKAAAPDGASSVRRSGGWKLAEEAACREDVSRICPKHAWNNNLAVLECLQDRKDETEIAADCNHLLWNYKFNLTTDPKFESVAVEVCKTTISGIKECAAEERGKGYLVSCLVDHRTNISEYQCNQYITKMTSIVFSDYRLICGFMDKCKDDINKLHCGSVNTGDKDIHSQGEVIACLEKGLVSEAEEQPAITIKEDCKKSIMRVAELSSDDFHLDRHLYFACREDRERYCENTPAGEGKVYKCLFNHKFEESMSDKCKDALSTRQKLIAQDYKVSYSLAKACKPDLRKYRCNMDTAMPRAREAKLSYLLLCLEAAVHRGQTVSGECQGEMLDYRRMLMEDYSLSPEIVLHCRGEIDTHCSGLHHKGRTLHCLMRVSRDKGILEGHCQKALQTLIQETDPGADYRIDRALNEACESVIQTACKHIRNGDPMILSCLMEHLYTDKMVEDCEHRLLELQYFISRDWKLDPILYKKCQNDASRICHTHGWNETSEFMPPGAVFSCLYRHAYRTEMQGRRLSRDCKTEVQRILHQRALDVKLDPELQQRCMTDLGKWCSEKTEAGQELECLQDHLDELVTSCRDVVGNLTELESEDIQIEALLIRACEPVIQSYCHEVADNQIDTGDLMECLVANKHQKEMNEKCTVGVTHFQLIQMKDFRFSYKFKMACKEDVLKLCPNIKKNNIAIVVLTMCSKAANKSKNLFPSIKFDAFPSILDYRLNPVLRKACKADIPKFCQGILNNAKDDNELEGQVISCLKLKYADQVRTHDRCEYDTNQLSSTNISKTWFCFPAKCFNLLLMFWSAGGLAFCFPFVCRDGVAIFDVHVLGRRCAF
uniref:Golgi apparatus protein 1 n=1 Tax=Sinocyclocheilus grahami TaxID=75366 RepID=A0A672JV33_SINGR